MLIEQIIEFQLRGAWGPLAVHVLLQLVIFMTKVSKKNLRLLFTSKILQQAMYPEALPKMVAPGAGFRGGTLFRTKNR